ncbi:MAG: hypothetical protein QOH90_214 [Actinomycetota bacterium]|nr:hypothetical protein [Actinomycetota bacterium]
MAPFLRVRSHLNERGWNSKMRRLTIVIVALGIAIVVSVSAALLPARKDPTPASARTSGRVSLQEVVAPPISTLDLDARIDGLQTRLKDNGEDPASLAQLAFAYLEKARITAQPTWYSKAGSALRSSLGVKPRGNFGALLGMAVLSNARHDFGGSLEWAARAIVLNPYNSYARAVKGDALLELGRYRAADRAFQEMIDLKPGLPSYARVSYSRELHGDVAGALAAMRSALRSAGEIGEDAAWASYQLGELRFGEGDLARASRLYRAASKRAPGYYLPEVGLAKVAWARGDVAGSIGILRGVVERFPLPQYVTWLGELYDTMGRHGKAARQFALVRVEQKLFAANGVIPDVEVTNFLSDHGSPKAALRLARQQYAGRRSIRVEDAFAWALYANGKYGRARRHEQRALRLGTKDAVLYFHAGMIAKRVGDRAAASRYLKRALSINPYFSILHSQRARMTLGRLGGS